MSFKINNKEGEGVLINDLDREACEFWGVEFNEKQYASPVPNFPNWFDCIGLYIHSQRRKDKPEIEVEWCDVAGLMAGYMLLSEDADQAAESIKGYWSFYFKLINHWRAMGYRAVAVYE